MRSATHAPGALAALRDALRDELDRLFIKLRLPNYAIAAAGPRDAVAARGDRTAAPRSGVGLGTPAEPPDTAVTLLTGTFEPAALSQFADRLEDAELASAIRGRRWRVCCRRRRRSSHVIVRRCATGSTPWRSWNPRSSSPRCNAIVTEHSTRHSTTCSRHCTLFRSDVRRHRSSCHLALAALESSRSDFRAVRNAARKATRTKRAVAFTVYPHRSCERVFAVDALGDARSQHRWSAR